MGDVRSELEKSSLANPRIGESATQFINALVEKLSVNSRKPEGLFLNELGGMCGPDLLPTLKRIDLLRGAADRDAEFQDLKLARAKLVVGLNPFGVKSGGSQPAEASVTGAVEALKYLAPDGVGLFMLSGFNSAFRRSSIEDLMVDQGFHTHAVINAPKHLLGDYTALRPIFIVVRKTNPEKVFFLDALNAADALIGLDNFNQNSESSDIHSGIWLSLADFSGFEAWHLAADLEAIGGDYTTYDEYNLNEISVAISSCKTGETFTHQSNAIYIPMLGPSPVFANLTQATLKHQNYAQVVLDSKKVSPEFVVNFLNSKYGRALRKYESESRGAVIPRMNLSQLRGLRVSLPPLRTQLEICSTISKLTRLREMVTEIEENISISPVSSMESRRNVDLALEVFGRLTEEDQLLEKIRRGESKVTEFKQTFKMETKDGSKQKYIEDSVIKTIGAFLNSDGGDLFVGVDDEGQIVGIDTEVNALFHKSIDKFLLAFKTSLKTRIGEQFYPYIDQKIVELKGSRILHVKCDKSPVEVFVDGDDFFVRTNPATDKLEGKKLVDYIRQRFGGTPAILS